MIMDKKKCDKECNGTIKEIKVRGLEYPSKHIVEYEIDNKVYEVKENLVMKPHEIIKFWFIPIGYKTKSLIEIKTGIPATVGNSVRVKYYSKNPNVAFLPDNDSKTTGE